MMIPATDSISQFIPYILLLFGDIFKQYPILLLLIPIIINFIPDIVTRLKKYLII